MDFNRRWTPFALEAEKADFGFSRIAAAHNAVAQQLDDIRQAWQDCREEFTELRRELDEARAALRDWYHYLHDEDDWDDMVSPASHQWRVRHAAALKAAREAQ